MTHINGAIIGASTSASSDRPTVLIARHCVPSITPVAAMDSSAPANSTGVMVILATVFSAAVPPIPIAPIIAPTIITRAPWRHTLSNHALNSSLCSVGVRLSVFFAASNMYFAVCMNRNNPNPSAISTHIPSSIAFQNISVARPITENSSPIYLHIKQPDAVAMLFPTPMAAKNPSMLVYVIAAPPIDDDRYHIPTPMATSPIIRRIAIKIS